MTAALFSPESRKRLYDEIVILHDSWAQYRFLFTESNERMQLLNVCGSWFFRTTQRNLLREVVLGISRLTDPIKTGKFDNLTIGMLLLDLSIDSHIGLRDRLDAAVAAAIGAADPMRPHRHKYIAHLDHPTALGSAVSPIPALARQQITDAINALDFIGVNADVVGALADSEGMKQLDGSIVALTSCSPAGTALGA